MHFWVYFCVICIARYTIHEKILKSFSHYPQENKVRVDTSNAGEGALSVSIRAAGQEVRHTIQDLANGQYDVLFYPTMAIGKTKAPALF